MKQGVRAPYLVRLYLMGLNFASSAFTLVELLATISIIGILTGLLTVGITKAKEQSLTIHCGNNLRQLGIAVRLYADGNDGRLPNIGEPHITNNGMAIFNYSIRQMLYQTAASDQVFHCAKDKTDNFRLQGSSYEWNSIWNGKLIDKSGRNVDTLMKKPLLFDSEARHKARNRRNAVFLDAHVQGIDSL